MKKSLLSLSLLGVCMFANAQVGIGTDTPQATLDVVGKPTDTATPDGIVAPRVTRDELSAKDAVYTAAQTGAIVYVTNIPFTIATGKTSNISKVGYYYFDGAKWMMITPDLRLINSGNHLTIDAGKDANGTSLGTGSNNIAIGIASQGANTTASSNIGIGPYTLMSNETGSNNIALGVDALMSSTTSSNLVAIGYQALSSNTTALRNVAIGNQTLLNNTTSNDNTAIGNGALSSYQENSFSGGNTALGNYTAMNLKSGTQNTTIGNRTLTNLTTGSDNTAIGSDALTNSTVSNGNTAVGRTASQTLKGDNNSSLGFGALSNSYTLNINNTALGYNAGTAGTSITGLTATDATFLGSSASIDGGLTTGTISFATAVGAGAKVGASNSIVLGRPLITPGGVIQDKVGIGVIAPTNALHVKNTADPVKFEGLVADTNAANVVVVGTDGVLKTVAKNTFATSTADTTNDAWVNNPVNTRVELGTLSDGTTARTAGTEVVMTDTGRVGIKTAIPNASLEVKKSTTTPTTSVDGVIPPNITKKELSDKLSGTYTANQKSALVYVSDISGTFTGASASQVADITSKGYHYFDDTIAPNGRWVSLYDPKNIAIPIVYGTMASTATGGVKNINPIGTGATPLNSYITLGPGKWLVSVNILLYANDALRLATTSPWIWSRLTFNDGTTLANIQSKTAQTTDFVGSSLISGSFFSPPTPGTNGQRPTYVYSMLSGQVVINNTSGADKMYGLLWWSSESNTTATGYQFINLSSAGNGENVITAMKIQ